MNRDYEGLSAFLDGESDELESRRLLRDLDSAGQATLARWQLASDLLQGHSSVPVAPGFNRNLAAALANESQAAARPAWMGGVLRVAVAASVAAATVVGWYSWDSTRTELDGQPAMVAASADTRMTRPLGQTALASRELAAPVAANDNAAPAMQPTRDQDRVNAMLLRHSEFSARHGGQSMVPFARLVSLDARQSEE